MFDKTMTFSVNEDKEAELKKNLTIIYDALMQKGYVSSVKEAFQTLLMSKFGYYVPPKPYPSYRP